MSARILIAVDGSSASMKAVDLGGELARARAATVCLVHVVPSAELPEGLREWARTEHVPAGETPWLYSRTVADGLLDSAEGRLRAQGVEAVEKVVEHGDAAAAIVELAEARHADAVVLGTRGLGNLSRLVLGSVAQKVMHDAPCTVVTVR